MFFCVERTVCSPYFILALKLIFRSHHSVYVCVCLRSKSCIPRCYLRVYKALIFTWLRFLCDFVQIEFFKDWIFFSIFMYQMERFLWHKRILFFILKLLKVAEVLMLYSTDLRCLYEFFCLFGRNGFDCFISRGNSFLLIELNSGIFQFSLVNNYSMVELSDWFQGFLSFLKTEITLKKQTQLFVALRGIWWLIQGLIGLEKFKLIFSLWFMHSFNEKLTNRGYAHSNRSFFLKRNMFRIFLIQRYLIILNDRLFVRLFFLGTKIDGIGMFVPFKRAI